MKKSFLDNAAMLPINIDIADESTLYENTGVDYDKVRNKVCESLHMNKTKKNKLTLKKLFIVAAAAVLIVSVFSLPVIAESVYMVYCYVVSGDSYALELANARDAKISISDPNLQINSIKLGGENSGSNIIDIRVSKIDGSTFTDSYFNTVKPCRFNAYSTSTGNPDSDNVHDLEVKIEDVDSEINGLGSKALYDVEEGGKILHILIYLTAEGKSGENALIGKKIKINSYSYTAASVEETLKTYKDMSDANFQSAIKLKAENESLVSYDIFTNSNAYTDLIYVGDEFELVKGHVKTYSLPFEIEFTMDNDISLCKYNLDNNTLYDLFGNEQTDGVMNISIFSFSINAVNDGKHYGEKIRFDPESCYVKTKDGNKYYLVADGCSYQGKQTLIRCEYGIFPNNSKWNNYNSSVCVIDVQNIEKIVFNGITVYPQI